MTAVSHTAQVLVAPAARCTSTSIDTSQPASQLRSTALPPLPATVVVGQAVQRSHECKCPELTPSSCQCQRLITQQLLLRQYGRVAQAAVPLPGVLGIRPPVACRGGKKEQDQQAAGAVGAERAQQRQAGKQERVGGQAQASKV